MLARYAPVAGYLNPAGEVWLRHADALRLLDECEAQAIAVLGFDLAAENSDGTMTMFLPIADLSGLLDEPQRVSTTVAEARRMIHDGLPSTRMQREHGYSSATLVSFALIDAEEL